MPMITMEFDDTKVTDQEIQALAEAMQKIVSIATDIEDVFVYANSARIRVKIAPIEVFVQMTASKINNVDELTDAIKHGLSKWKQSQGFKHPINLTMMPMDWKVEIGI